MLIGIIVLFSLILFHELGHFVAAKLCGVRVEEFAIGMGPKFMKWGGKNGNTLYSLRILPIGGFCEMAGENEAKDTPDSLLNAPWWKKILIYAAGPFINIMICIILTLCLTLSSTSPILAAAYANEESLLSGDQICQVDDFNIFLTNDLYYAEAFSQDGKYDVTFIRDGEKMVYTDYEPVSGSIVTDVTWVAGANDVTGKLSYTCRSVASMTQNIFLSLKHLILGHFTIQDMAGPIGITNSFQGLDLKSVFTLAAFISLNLGIFNFLPLPVLDGGQIFRVLIERVSKKEIPEQIVEYVNLGCMAALLLLIAAVTISDLTKLF